MNIKQASKQSGVSAPNIRFYEKEGLLNPARLPGNDYRDYTEQDIRTLRFIRMLRMLDVPLPVIRSVLAGDASLGECPAGAKDRTGTARKAAGRGGAFLCRTGPAGPVCGITGCGRLPVPDGGPCAAAELFLRLGAGLPHAGAGAASETLFLYPAGQHQHAAGVCRGLAGVCRGTRDAAQPDKRRNVPGVFAGWHSV